METLSGDSDDVGVDRCDAVSSPIWLRLSGSSQVRHCPSGRELLGAGSGGVHDELAFVETRNRGIERLDVGAAIGTFHAFEQPGLVAFGLQPTDHPRARVRDRLVVDVDGVLGRQHQPDAERSSLFEDGQDRLLGWRHRRGRDEAEHFVHVDKHAQVVATGLATHPCHDLRQQECDDELSFLVGEMMDVDDGSARGRHWLETAWRRCRVVRLGSMPRRRVMRRAR